MQLILLAIFIILTITCHHGDVESEIQRGVKDCKGNSLPRSQYPFSITNISDLDISVVLSVYPIYKKYYQNKMLSVNTQESKEVLKSLPFVGTKESYLGKQLPDNIRIDFKDMKMTFIIHPNETVILDRLFPTGIGSITYFDDINIITHHNKLYYGCNLYEQPFFLDCFKKKHFCNLEVN